MITEKFSLDHGWKFHKNDIEQPLIHTHTQCYMAAKAGGATGPASPDFDKSDWEDVNLPHDWAVYNEFDEKYGPAQGYKARGKGWYAKTFRLNEEDFDKQILIEFDGVATYCTVYMNGSVVGRNFCGYNSFTIDVTDVAVYGDKLNTLVVFVDATIIEGWWYEGAGIYRHVNLFKKNKTAIEHHGVFIHPELKEGEAWDARTDTDITNTDTSDKHLILKSRIINDEGITMGQARTELDIAAGETLKVEQSVLCYGIERWDINNPVLYTMVSELYEGNELIDCVNNKFGFRTIAIDKDKGFFLNGRHVPLYGTCNHQDHAGVGVAVPDSINEYRIRLLKEMGSNAYRCAHGNPSPEILDACDKYGILVMDENRNFNTSSDGLKQARDMVIRDRNHPCVIMYSIFNEEPLQGTPTGKKLAIRLDREIKRLDNTRFTVGAMNNGVTSAGGACDVLDMTGFNYITHTYDDFRKRFPNMPMLGSENDSAFQTRGVYKTDHAKHIIDCYDSEAAPWGNTYRDGFRQVDTRPHILGLFIWTGFDYRGEPTPFEWPSIGTQFGIMDTCGFKKDAFYLNKAFFTDEPMIHILPHWNFKEGERVRIMTHTNCTEAELFLNGESLGKKNVDKYDMADWYVDFVPGTLSMTGYIDGKAVCTDEVRTAGKPVSLELETSCSHIYSGCDDAIAVNIRAVDENGIFVPYADHLIEFSCEGGTIIGVGNGDPNSHEADKATTRHLFNGLCQAIVQLNPEAAKLTVKASAQGLKECSADIEIKPNEKNKAYIESVNEQYISGWRTNVVLFDEKPSPDIKIEDHDMNNWVLANMEHEAKYYDATGYGIYKTKANIPEGTKSIMFREIVGNEIEIYINNSLAAHGDASWGKAFEIKDVPTGTVEITVIIHSTKNDGGGGIAKSVVLLD